MAWSVLHWIIVPRIDEFRPRLEQMASRAASTPVTIGAIEAESNGLVPSISLRDVRVHDLSGRAGLVIPRVLVAFSVLSLSKRELEQLVIDQPQLELRRTADGRLLVGGVDMSGDASASIEASDWFFSQSEFLVRGGKVSWVDESRNVPPVTFSDVQFIARNGFGRHQLRLDATPEPAWGERFTLIGQFRQPLLSLHSGQWRDWDGQVFANFSRADVSQLGQYVDLEADMGVDLQAGQGALRLWTDVKKGQFTNLTADLALGAVSATFGPKLEPLAFASLAGRIGWSNLGAGVEVTTRDLNFVDADGVAWPGGNVRLSYRDGAAGAVPGGDFSGDRLDLAALAKIAQRLPLSPEVGRQLRDHPVKGLIEHIEGRWSGPLDAPRDWRLQTKISQLSVGARPAPQPPSGKPVAGMPGVEGATLQLEALPTGGSAVLEVKNGALEFPGVFAEPRIPVAEFKVASRWRSKGGQFTIDVDQLALRNQDATATFKGRWNTTPGKQGPARFPGELDLSGNFSRANGARVYRYLPLGIAAEARDYVQHAVLKGEARDMAVRVKGDLNRIGEDSLGSGGAFRFSGQVRGVTLAYVPRALQPEGEAPWPALEDLSGELIFDHNTMQVNHAKGTVQGYPGWQFTQIQAGIADLHHTRVLVDAQGKGTLESALGIVRTSPVGGFIGHALDRATGSGDAALQLKLDLPVSHIHEAKAEGRVNLAGNDVRIAPDTPLLAQANGAITFSDAGFAIQDARARWLGGEVRLSGGTSKTAPPGEKVGEKGVPPVVLHAAGTFSAEALREMAEWGPVPEVARLASGSAAYEARMSFRGDEPELLVTSDLRGMAFDLPAPLEKQAEATLPLRFESGPVTGAEGRSRFRLTVGEQLALEFQRDTKSGRTLRGAIGVGQAAVTPLALPASGVHADLQLPRLDVGAWETTLAAVFSSAKKEPAASAEGGFVPTAWSLRTGELVLDDRTVHDVNAKGTRQGNTWRANVQARELAGRVDYTEGTDGRAGKVLARLSHLTIPAGSDDQSVQAQPITHMPALDVVAEDFELRGKKLGRLEINAVNHDTAPTSQVGALQTWELTRFVVRSPEAVFTASGRWEALARRPAVSHDPRGPRAPDDPRRTTLDFKLDIRDAGALLTRFDMPGVLARGQGVLSGDLNWRGSPMSPHYPSMAGKVHLDVGAGQFLKADPGVAKLLGVLSLQALPRRLTLDFRDIFSTGFAFDFVRGDVAIARGIAQTNNLQMKGVNAAVLMDGSADIDKETQDLRVLVVPEIDAGTAALVATAINPAIGLVTFLAQLVLKRPLSQANTKEFHIGGSWDNPTVQKLEHSARRLVTGEQK
ncbi:YhdP family protein [Ottowia thiooxydans]|uniref:YhdP family protein n=1 Tax=Ottowia thiooxydans TaxID=219182 RepID=UPI001FE05011